MKHLAITIITCITIVIIAGLFSRTFQHRGRAFDTITATGLGTEDFSSDLIVWRGSFTRKNVDLKAAYSALNHDREAIGRYLIDKGVAEKQIVFSSIDLQKETKDVRDNAGNTTQEFTGYRLTQNIQIESPAIDKIENVSRSITDLIEAGIEFHSETPKYYYTKMAELKIRMIASSTRDARLRAETIAKNAGCSLGKLRNAAMGVFQITGQNSSEEYSGGGTFNTWSKLKTATITMKLRYEIE
jgi:hypothetical protein